MELRHLSAFVAVFEEGSFNRAAQRLDLAQPSISATIRHLEHELGVALFERMAHGARPLPAGETFYRHCLRVLAEIDGARLAVGHSSGRISGRISVGLGPTVAKGIMPRFLPRYLDDFPEVEVRLSEAFSGPLIEWTLSGQLDFAVVVLPAVDRRLVTRRLGAEPILLVAAPGHRPLLETPGHPLKLILPVANNGLRNILDRHIHATGLPVARFIEVDSLHGMMGLVLQSDWVTMVAASSAASEIRRGDLAATALRPPLSLDFYIIHPARKALSPAASAFVERLKAEFERARTDRASVLSPQ